MGDEDLWIFHSVLAALSQPQNVRISTGLAALGFRALLLPRHDLEVWATTVAKS